MLYQLFWNVVSLFYLHELVTKSITKSFLLLAVMIILVDGAILQTYSIFKPFQLK